MGPAYLANYTAPRKCLTASSRARAAWGSSCTRRQPPASRSQHFSRKCQDSISRRMFIHLNKFIWQVLLKFDLDRIRGVNKRGGPRDWDNKWVLPIYLTHQHLALASLHPLWHSPLAAARAQEGSRLHRDHTILIANVRFRFPDACSSI